MGIVLEYWTARSEPWIDRLSFFKSAPFVSADLAHDEWMLPMMMIVRRHALLDRDAARRFLLVESSSMREAHHIPQSCASAMLDGKASFVHHDHGLETAGSPWNLRQHVESGFDMVCCRSTGSNLNQAYCSVQKYNARPLKVLQ
jgi:hypothetical protein